MMKNVIFEIADKKGDVFYILSSDDGKTISWEYDGKEVNHKEWILRIMAVARRHLTAGYSAFDLLFFVRRDQKDGVWYIDCEAKKRATWKPDVLINEHEVWVKLSNGSYVPMPMSKHEFNRFIEPINEFKRKNEK